jgi:hypothetical protein
VTPDTHAYPGTKHAIRWAGKIVLETNVTVLVVALVLLFGVVAVWAGWHLIDLDRERTGRRLAGGRAGKAKSGGGGRRLEPLRVRICVRQIRGARHAQA